MQKTVNNVNVNGYVFSHTLQNRVSKKNGTPFIMGDINIATDEDATNVVTVHFSYVTETFGKSGKPNPTYPILQELIDNDGPTYEHCGKQAMKLRVAGNIENNDFVTRDGEIASPKRIGGSFVHKMNDMTNAGATFDVDMLIAGVTEREVEDGDDYANLRGYVFNYRGDAVAVDFNIRSQGGIDYFVGAEVSNSSPMFTHINGEIVSQALVNHVELESAFGEPLVREVVRNIRSWDVTWAAVEPYEFGDESVLTKKELKQKIEDRNTHLAEVKKNHDEYMANREGGHSFASPSKSAVKVSEPAANNDDDDEFDFAF